MSSQGSGISRKAARQSARDKLIAAAHEEVRRYGYCATSVDQICAAAGVTKGAFFHHFASKEALAVAAAQAWTERASALFETQPAADRADPLERLLAHIDVRIAMIEGTADQFCCFVGTMVQEAYATHDPIRAACEASIMAYCDALAPDIDEAIRVHGAPDGMTAASIARHVQAVIQGSFVLAKATNSSAIARESLVHLRHYIAMLFGGGRPDA